MDIKMSDKQVKHKCQWCLGSFLERYMEKWNNKWQCKARFKCTDRINRYMEKWNNKLCKERENRKL
jgi:hypothetical protein